MKTYWWPSPIWLNLIQLTWPWHMPWDGHIFGVCRLSNLLNLWMEEIHRNPINNEINHLDLIYQLLVGGWVASGVSFWSRVRHAVLLTFRFRTAIAVIRGTRWFIRLPQLLMIPGVTWSAIKQGTQMKAEATRDSPKDPKVKKHRITQV